MAWPTVQVSAGTGEDFSGPTTKNFNHTCAATDTVLRVLIGTGTGSGADAVTGVTYNSVAMANIANQSDGNFERVQIWQLNSPTTGTNTVAVTFGSGAIQFFPCAISFDGASTTVKTPSYNSASSANPTVTVTDSASGDIVIAVIATDNGGAIAQAGSIIGEAEGVAGDSTFNAQYQTASGASTVCSWTATAGDLWIAVGIAISQAEVGATIPEENDWQPQEPHISPMNVSVW